MPHPVGQQDLEIVRGVLAGRAQSLEQFVERMRCVPRILAAQNAQLGRPLDDHDLADLTQDVLVLVWKKLPEYEGRSELAGWVYRFCVLQSMNAARRKTRHRHKEFDETLSRSTGQEAPLEHEEVHAGLARVPAEEAEIIRLKHFENLSLDAVAKRLGQPTSSIKSRYYRGIERLSAFLHNRRKEAAR